MLYLVRHGETVLPKGICIGQTDTPLAKQGIKNITEKTLPNLAALQLENPRLISSPLSRTMQTAQILSNGLNIPVEQEAALKEINMGKWDGLAFSYIKKHYTAEYEQRGTDFAYFRTPCGESFFDLQQRVLEFIIPLCHTKGSAIIVTHAGVIRTLLCAAKQTPLQELFIYKVTTGSITAIPKATFAEKGLYLA